MLESGSVLLFVVAAVVIAVTPGPGILYVAARTLAGGRDEGMASCFGTGLGGLIHVVAGAVGVSALVMASAELFTMLKLAGAAYLVWLGVRTFRSARAEMLTPQAPATGAGRAFRDGVVVEALNPKTAAFFLAFIPQFIDPAPGQIAGQFIAFGLASVTLNTLADLVVAVLASSLRHALASRPSLIGRMREGSAVILGGLGVSLVLARRPT